MGQRSGVVAILIIVYTEKIGYLEEFIGYLSIRLNSSRPVSAQ